MYLIKTSVKDEEDLDNLCNSLTTCANETDNKSICFILLRAKAAIEELERLLDEHDEIENELKRIITG